MSKDQKENADKLRLDWHSGFEGSLQLSLRKYASDIEIEREHTLSKEPLRIDFLVVKKNTGVVIDNSIGRDFRTYNLIEYKNPNDELNIDVLWKVIGYAGLFKSFGNKVDEIKAEEITISIYRARKPVKLFGQLEEKGYIVSVLYPGVYQISGMVCIPINIIVIKELDDQELNAIKILTYNPDEADIRAFLLEASKYKNPGDKRSADAVLQISANVNRKLFERIRGDRKMCEALRELMAEDLKDAEKKGIGKGIEQGIEQGIE